MLIALIKVYQFLGEAKHQLLTTAFGVSSHCKHTPSCSRYLVIQIREHGTIVGIWKGLQRFLTCW